MYLYYVTDVDKIFLKIVENYEQLEAI